MKISVITTSFNSEKTILDTLASVKGQDYKNREHILIDGASTDSTLSLASSVGDGLGHVISEPDRGVYDAMNKGVRLASGEVIGFLNSDDFFAHDGVLSRIAELMSDPDVDACYADLDYVDPVKVHRVVRMWRSRSYTEGLFERGWMPAHPTFYVRRSVFERLGGFDLQFPRQADFELAMRFMAKGKIRTQYCPEVWVKMRTGGISNNSFRGVIKGNLEAYRACKKCGLDVGPLFIPIKMLSRLPQFVKAALAK